MTRAFTLLELLAVIGMMSVLGAVSVVAGVSVSRGLDDRAARQALSGFLGNVRRMASTEGVHAEVVFTCYDLAETEDDPRVELCRAVAVRRGGRVSRIVDGRPWDEFSDAGALALDEADGIVLPEGELQVGSEYGIVMATLELPADYTVEERCIRFVLSADGTVRQEGSASLVVRRGDGRREQVGKPVTEAETGGLR